MPVTTHSPIGARSQRLIGMRELQPIVSRMGRFRVTTCRRFILRVRNSSVDPFSPVRPMTPRFLALAVATSVFSAGALIAQRVADLTGNWNFKVVTENGTGTPTVTMKQSGDSLTGTYESARMGSLPFKGGVKGNTFTFAVNTSGGATLTFSGTIVDNDNVKGDVDFGGQGGATFSGERRK
jgi:hypothetical protein